MRSSLLFILLMTFSFVAMAQSESSSSPWSVGINLKSNGWGFGSSKNIKTADRWTVGLDLDLSTLKHSKELRIQSTELANPIPYVYGKARRAIQFNPSVFYSYKIGAARNNSPAVYFGVEVGPSVAITRPVYVYYIAMDQSSQFGQQLRTYDREVHNNQSFIQGDAGWNLGFGELRYQAGLHTAVYTELLKNSEYVYQRLKLGMNVDYYFSDLGLMYDTSNRFFAALFMKYQFAASR